MIDYSYSERISENEKRIADLKGKLITTKLSIQALENENERCVEAMNNKTSVVNTDSKDAKIVKLLNTIEKLKEEKFLLRCRIGQLEDELKSTTEKFEKEKSLFNQKIFQTNDSDVILADNFGVENVFDEFIGDD